MNVQALSPEQWEVRIYSMKMHDPYIPPKQIYPGFVPGSLLISFMIISSFSKHVAIVIAVAYI